MRRNTISKYTITFNNVLKHKPCEKGAIEVFLEFHGKNFSKDTPVTLIQILKSNGIEDALWCLRCIENIDRDCRLFACDCAESVVDIFEKRNHRDSRFRDSIEVARRFANGEGLAEEFPSRALMESTARCDWRRGYHPWAVEDAWDAAFESSWISLNTYKTERQRIWKDSKTLTWGEEHSRGERYLEDQATIERRVGEVARRNELKKQEILFRKYFT